MKFETLQIHVLKSGFISITNNSNYILAYSFNSGKLASYSFTRFAIIISVQVFDRTHLRVAMLPFLSLSSCFTSLVFFSDYAFSFVF